MPNNVQLKNKGLHTFANSLSELPPGSLRSAKNVILNRDSIIEPRRGNKLYGTSFGTSSNVAKQGLVYKGRILRHWGTTLEWDTQALDANNNSIFTAFNGSYTEPSTGTRIKFIESNSNLYFTTSTGIKKISITNASQFSTSSITSAGGIKALDTSVALNSQIGFFTQDSVISYRILWGYKDANTNQIDGVPSERSVIYNPITALLITDFNNLLTLLDSQNVATGIHAQNYVTTYKVAKNSASSVLRTNLINLASAIDTDIPAITISTVSGSGTLVTITTSTSVTNIISVGDTISVTGVNPAAYNKNYTVLTASGTTITATDTATGAYVSGGSLKRVKYANIAQPVALSTVPTTTQLLSMQAYYDAIVNDLQLEPSGICSGAAFSGANSTQSATVNVTFTVPSGVTTAYFYQIYRTHLTTSLTTSSLSDLDPGDEHYLAYEGNPSSTDISNGTITVQDITPESFLGEALYTNPNSGQGILSANEVPPLATDMAYYKGYTFYANTQTKYQLEVDLLSVTKLTSGVSTFTITNGTTTNSYKFVSPVAEVTSVTTVADVAANLNGKYFTLNSGKNTTSYYVWYSNGAGADPALSGKTGIKVTFATNDTANTIASKTKTTLNQNNDFTVSVLNNVLTITNTTAGIATDATAGTSGFTVSVTTQGTGEDATNKKILLSNLATPSQQVDETARSLVHVINLNAGEIVNAYYLSGPEDVPGKIFFEARSLGGTAFNILADTANSGSQFSPTLAPTNTITNISIANPTVITSTAHGLSTGNKIMISGSNSTPSVDGIYTITKVDANTFTIPVNVTGSGTLGGWILQTNAQVGDNNVSPNGVYYSKQYTPEAVPTLNFIPVGPKDKKILRILALRDSLFILKEDAIWRLSGETAPFIITLFDSSTNLKAPDSAVVLNNLIYGYTTQGIARVSDTGVEIISRDIEDLLLPLLSPAYTNFTTATNGMAYESDRSYYVWTVTNTSDTYATQCFRYNTFTSSWTIFDKGFNFGIVNPADDKMYSGATDTNYIQQERKNFDITDYCDREYTSSVPDNAISSTKITLGTLLLATGVNLEIGDVFSQTQYLTVSQYNRLLKMLDTDNGLNFKAYYTTYQVSAGSNLRTSLTQLAQKLDVDSGIAVHNYAATIAGYTTSFSDTQLAFNAIVANLNADTGTKLHNYPTSSGTVVLEVPITNIVTSTKVITTLYPYPFISGTATVYKHYECEVEWAPQFMGDASLSKHIRDGTVIFENNSFSTAYVAYSTDLNPEYVEITFPGKGTGAFGADTFGSPNTFGGSGNGAPLRTLIPKDKQRGRFINVRFRHAVARETFAIKGMSQTFEVMSTRAYR